MAISSLGSTLTVNSTRLKCLNLSKNLKIINIEGFSVDYINNKKILNSINLKKNNSGFIIEGESFLQK